MRRAAASIARSSSRAHCPPVASAARRTLPPPASSHDDRAARAPRRCVHGNFWGAIYDVVVLLWSGLKKMGEVQLAVRFACPVLLPDTWAMYAQPMLPRMHYLRPIGVAQQEALHGAAIRTVAGWLARAEPPLGPEVVRYVLDADAHGWSVRRSKANWFRIMGVVAWAMGLACWVDDVRR